MKAVARQSHQLINLRLLLRGRRSRLLRQLKERRGNYIKDFSLDWRFFEASCCRMSARKRQRSRKEAEREKRGSSESSSEEERCTLPPKRDLYLHFQTRSFFSLKQHFSLFSNRIFSSPFLTTCIRRPRKRGASSSASPRKSKVSSKSAK